MELTNEESYFMRQLAEGEIDALVSLDSFGAKERVVPVSKLGASEYYFVVNKARPDLLSELNSALTAIQDEDPYFNQRLFDEYVQLVKTNAFLSQHLESWLEEHGTIRVGYWDNYLPFCAEDKISGNLTGALKDYLTHASYCLKNAEIHFDPLAYSSLEEALEGMKRGEVDCVFPINLNTYDAEMRGVLTADPIMKTEMSVLMRTDGRSALAPGNSLTVAIDEGNLNFETFIRDKFPEWTIKVYPDMGECFRAVSEKEADAVLACSYRRNEYEPLRTRYKLVALPTGETMGLSLAMNSHASELYSILNKIVNLSTDDGLDYALATYMGTTEKTSFTQFLKDHLLGVLLFIAAVFALVVMLMNNNVMLLNNKLKAEQQVNDQQKEIEEALRRELKQKERLQSVTQIAYTDPLTGVKSKHAYTESVKRMDRRIEEKTVSAFGVVLFDLNGLKEVNDTQGHEVGNQLIKEACRIICTCFKQSPVYRIGGDEFVAILEGADYEKREELLKAFDSQMDSNRAEGKLSVSSGCACFDPACDNSFRVVFERADAKMYERKRQMKERNP